MSNDGNSDQEGVTEDGDALEAEPLEAEPLEAERLRPTVDRDDDPEGAIRDGDAIQAQQVQAEPVQAEPVQADPLEAQRLSEADPSRGAAGTPRPSGMGHRLGIPRSSAFLRLWGSQVVSNAGDWVYVLAVASILAGKIDGAGLAKAMGLLLAAGAAPSAIFGLLFAGSIADRFDRRRVMVVSDLVRACAVGSLLIVPEPSIAHFLVVAAILGLFQSLFQPSLMAALPNTVPADQLLRANAVVTGTYHLAIMVGPAIGAALVSALGAETAIAVNAGSFVVSASLLAGVRLGRATDEEARTERWEPIRDLREGLRHVANERTARGVVIVMGLALLLLPAKAPAEIVMVRDQLTGGSPAAVAAALGILTAAFGAGMVAGSMLAPAIGGRLRREHALVGAIAAIGVCYLLAARADSVPQLALVWGFAGAAGGLLNVAYETLLQECTPDRFRGRVFALAEATQDATYLAGALFVGAFGVAGGFAPVGIATLGVALLALGILPRIREVAAEEVPSTAAALELAA